MNLRTFRGADYNFVARWRFAAHPTLRVCALAAGLPLLTSEEKAFDLPRTEEGRLGFLTSIAHIAISLHHRSNADIFALKFRRDKGEKLRKQMDDEQVRTFGCEEANSVIN